MHSYLSFYTVENNIKLLTKGHLFYDSFVKRNRTESGKVIYSKLNLLDENCPESEITCHTTKKECRYTYRVFNTNVSLYIQFPKLKFIQATKILVLDCYCKEYIFNCTINSQVLRSIGE